jgi:DNA-binding response OmpR family regulator
MADNKIKILLVEDNPGDVRLVQEMVKEAGTGQYELSVEGTLDGLLSRLRKASFDAVLLDLNLPDSRGIATIKSVQGNAPFIPVIVITGLDDETIASESLKLGAEDFLIKGKFDNQLLLRALRYAIERKRAEQALRESEWRLKKAQSLGRIGNWEYDFTTKQILWSDEMFTLYERDIALGPPSEEEEAKYYSPEQAGILREHARRAQEAGEEFKYDLEVKLPSGKTAFFATIMLPVKSEEGQIVKVFGTAQDITEQKRMQEEIAKKVHDLEIFYKATMDREDMVIELKHKINALLKELGRAPTYQ